jgi:hypothetical protein
MIQRIMARLLFLIEQIFVVKLWIGGGRVFQDLCIVEQGLTLSQVARSASFRSETEFSSSDTDTVFCFPVKFMLF